MAFFHINFPQVIKNISNFTEPLLYSTTYEYSVLLKEPNLRVTSNLLGKWFNVNLRLKKCFLKIIQFYKLALKF